MIIIKKKEGASTWNYPADHKLFVMQFKTDDRQGLVVINNSGKTAAELGCEEYKGDSLATITKKESEIYWRNAELSRTDILALLDDFPKKIELTAYRVSLRDYPTWKDFPNGDRPEMK